MHSLYARLVLWLIRPALERHNSIKTKITAESLPALVGLPARVPEPIPEASMRVQVTVNAPLYEAGVRAER